MITIKEIARLAGTSRGTVDRVLNGRGRVNPELARRILDIAEVHNYQSNPFAKALVRGGQRYLLGVILNALGNQFFDDVMAGIRDAADKYRDLGLEVRIRCIKGYDEAAQLSALSTLLESQPDAIAITPLDIPSVAARLSALAPLPILTLNSDIHIDTKLAFIGCDYLRSGRLSGDIAAMLLSQGGRAAIVTGSFHMLGHNQRIQGFREVLAGQSVDIVDIRENNDDNETSYRVTREILAAHQPDLLYFCAAGTEGGMQAVVESGSQVRVIVVDDIAPMRAHLQKGAIQAIVTQQPYQQGAMMVETCYDYLFYGKKPERVHNYMENQVKLRHSL